MSEQNSSGNLAFILLLFCLLPVLLWAMVLGEMMPKKSDGTTAFVVTGIAQVILSIMARSFVKGFIFNIMVPFLLFVALIAYKQISGH